MAAVVSAIYLHIGAQDKAVRVAAIPHSSTLRLGPRTHASMSRLWSRFKDKWKQQISLYVAMKALREICEHSHRRRLSMDGVAADFECMCASGV